MAMMPIAMGMMAAGTIMSVAGSMKQAQYARDAAEAQQQQLNYAAGQAEAAGQRRAIAEREQAQLLISRARAVSAASGGGSLDPALFAGLFEAGEENAATAMYTAQEQAAGARYKGQIGIMQAEQEGQVAKIKGIGGALQSIGTMGMMASKFGWPGAEPATEGLKLKMSPSLGSR